jgi:hypothetical protein
VRLLNQKRDAEIKAYQDSQRSSSANRQSGREVSSAEAASIARAAGLQVNSASRSYAQQKSLYDAWVAAGMPADNPVAKPGSSAHEGARGRWALDIQLEPGVTPELLRKVFSAQGISLSKVFLERGHYHIEGSRAQADAEQAVRDSEIPKLTAAQLRDQFYRQAEEDISKQPLELFDTETLAAQAEKLTGIRDDTSALAQLIATFPPIPDLSKIISEEEQHRIDDWVMSLEQDVAGALTDAIARSEDLGDALVNTFRRAASAMLESGILNLLSGGKQGVSFGSMITTVGSLFGSKTPAPLPNVPGMASGGDVTGGKLYRVNERGFGTEYFKPAGAGKIIPLGSPVAPQGGGVTVINSVHVNANDAVLADTVRDWVTQGMQAAAARGAIGGRTMTLDYINRKNRRRLG